MGSLEHDDKAEIGQHFVFGFPGYDVSPGIEDLIRTHHVGNIILFKRNVHSISQVRALTCRLQAIARDAGHPRPLLIGIDQENGLVSAFVAPGGEAGTQFPGAMALAAAGVPDVAEQVSAAAAKELKLAGISWVYSPVADVNSDPRNPVIGVRSFGDDAVSVSEHTRAVSQGLTSAGVASCPKHFPGHGDTHVDSHLALPTINKSRGELDQTELVPFRSLISSGVPSIMTGHMALPALTGDASPASLSRAVTTDLLRLELGYAGVIVTDCLEMDAVAVEYGSEAGAVRALQAGADIAMVCHRIDRQRGAVEHAYAAVRDGSLSMDVLRESGRRIAALKARFAGIWDDVLNESIDAGAVRALKESNAALSQRAYAMTATLVSSTSPSPIPFRHNGPLVLVAPRTSRLNPAVDDPTLSENAIGPGYLAFARALAARKEEEKVQTVVCGPDKFDWQPSTDDAVVVFVLRDAHRHRWQLDALQRVAGAAGRIAGIVLVATSGPYDITHARAAVAEGIPCACLATFEFTAPAMEAAAAVLFGERGAPGRMPVKL